MRLIAVSEAPLGTATLQLYGPNGQRVDTAVHRLDGPPFTLWTEVKQPGVGAWTAVLGEGSEVRACKKATVVPRLRRAVPRSELAAAWVPRWRWERDTENFYAAFVEQLFLEPRDEDVTWPKLQEVIENPARNLLYDHRRPGEDAALDLEPDCADLPYFLRAYFAWKLRLPFGFRDCSRGEKGRPPRCLPEIESNLFEVDARTDAGAFQKFSRKVATMVHSASARTVPGDSATDFYPVSVAREHLRPGTVFADPYGHLLVVARWKPQGVDRYGVLIAADAQPDGTVGRRRFWRGSFLFDPNTDTVGAGFKAWRPVRYVPRDQAVRDVGNAFLRSASKARRAQVPVWSTSQYAGDAEAFYASVERLVNPRPLDPVRLQHSLVDALEESIARRVNSVDNGEAYVASADQQIEMPTGAAIFQTRGPWEDYSTPSRDMRLLISIDAVTGFPDRVASSPERFGLAADEAQQGAAKVREHLEDELKRRRFSYKRSDGREWPLSMWDVVQRTKAFEMAYNPNDCPERRWGAPSETDEFSTCGRHAPDAQRQKMNQYRSWFAERRRPVH